MELVGAFLRNGGNTERESKESQRHRIKYEKSVKREQENLRK